MSPAPRSKNKNREHKGSDSLTRYDVHSPRQFHCFEFLLHLILQPGGAEPGGRISGSPVISELRPRRRLLRPGFSAPAPIQSRNSSTLLIVIFQFPAETVRVQPRPKNRPPVILVLCPPSVPHPPFVCPPPSSPTCAHVVSPLRDKSHSAPFPDET